MQPWPFLQQVDPKDIKLRIYPKYIFKKDLVQTVIKSYYKLFLPFVQYFVPIEVPVCMLHPAIHSD